MVLSTVIARQSDALPLFSSVDEDSDTKLAEQKQRVKVLLKKINSNSEPRASLESGQYTIHYLISNNFIYICICEKTYPRKLAFSFLEELDKEFSQTYGQEALKPGLRPYAFLQFDNFTQKTKRLYQDARATQNIDRLNAELQDVTKVMTKNIEDLLYRGDSLDRMQDMSYSLRSESKKYRNSARRINIEAMIRQYAPFAGIGLIFFFLIWWMFLR